MPTSRPATTSFAARPKRLRNLLEIGHEAVRLDSRGMIQFGILLLILTPVARVAFTALVFLVQRDYVFVAVTRLSWSCCCSACWARAVAGIDSLAEGVNL